MSKEDFLQNVKRTLTGFEERKDGSVQTPSFDPFAKTPQEEKSEQVRAAIFILAIFILAGILLFQFLGIEWARSLFENSEMNYVVIGVAVVATLIGLNIIMGIIKGIFNAVSMTTETGQKMAKKPMTKVIFWALGIYMGVSLFGTILYFMMSMGIGVKINDYLLNGFQFNVSTDEGEKLIQMEEGTLKIQDEQGEIKKYKILNTR